jgi:hypothetical protein
VDKDDKYDVTELGIKPFSLSAHAAKSQMNLGCALTFASEAKFEIEVKISFRLEAKKKPDFT